MSLKVLVMGCMCIEFVFRNIVKKYGGRVEKRQRQREEFQGDWL